jgi:hypothetical protein
VNWSAVSADEAKRSKTVRGIGKKLRIGERRHSENDFLSKFSGKI